MQLTSLTHMRELLKNSKTIAVVGLSPKKDRPSFMVAAYLIKAGYTVIPVNPGQTEILGQPCYPSLSAIPVAVDIVDIFRRSEDIPPVVEEAIRIGARAVWMQQGIVHDEAAAKAAAAGLTVVMDKCLKIEHANLL